MSDAATAEKAAKIRDRVTKLLALAENAAAEEGERKTYREKAEALMVEWGITEAMLDASRSKSEREKVTEDTGPAHTGRYAQAYMLFGAHIAEALGCKVYQHQHRQGSKSTYRLVVMGHTSDAARAHLLIASAQLQAQAALAAWWKAFDLKEVMTEQEKFRERRAFLIAFAAGVAERLREHRATQTADPAPSGASTGTPSAALVLADRAAEVEAYAADRVRGMRTGRALAGGEFGGGAGRQAGREADLGMTDRVGQSARGALSA